MLRLLAVILTIISGAVLGLAQTDVQRLVDAENGFASMAAEQGTRAAFLANMSGDALVFVPDRTVAKAFWTARPTSTSLLSWAPNYADVSANGLVGYTTGNWEFRPKGKDDQPTGFGDFITIWVRQPDGRYKFSVDIGVEHGRPPQYSKEWKTSGIKERDLNEKNSSAADSANGFYAAVADRGLAKAIEIYGTDDIRGYREKEFPFIGKRSYVERLKSENAKYALPKRSTFFGSADLAYNLNTYTKMIDGKVVEKGNTMQIWKLVNGKWRIVLDIFKPAA